MNKHLRKIIDDYLDYKFPFITEIENITKSIEFTNKNWIFYDRYSVKIGYSTTVDDPMYKHEYKIGYKNYSFNYIGKYNNSWHIFYRYK